MVIDATSASKHLKEQANQVISLYHSMRLKMEKYSDKEEYKDILEQYKEDKDAFIFLDPPYLFSNNKVYDPFKDGDDMTHIIWVILEYLKTCSCRVMLIISINDLFYRFCLRIIPRENIVEFIN